MKLFFNYFFTAIKIFIFLLGLAWILLNTIFGIGQQNVFYPDICTEYTSDFRKDNFWWNIRSGQDKADVIKSLGSPFQIDTLNRYACDICCTKNFYKMTYSKEKYNRFCSFAWCAYNVYLDDNLRVTYKEEKWWED